MTDENRISDQDALAAILEDLRAITEGLRGDSLAAASTGPRERKVMTASAWRELYAPEGGS